MVFVITAIMNFLVVALALLVLKPIPAHHLEESDRGVRRARPAT